MSKAKTAGNSFNDNFLVLQRNAERLREEKDLDIDSLVPLVEESARAYQLCKARIDAVKQALEAHLQSGDEQDGAGDRT
ncbi:MAG TPA: exodeoxyribonuclease VII [Fluviicoccus sp.]|nr:exodeoxyribonuclease VII [Fluviicoccus sp.]